MKAFRASIPRLLPLALALAAAGSLSLTAQAASHREAPFITTAPKVDGTDFYMFRSYEAGRQDFVTIIANYLPLQDPYGGPNYFSLDSNALYEIHIDNNGDAVEDLTFQFRFANTLAASGKGVQLTVGTGANAKQVSIPLRQAGPVNGQPNDPLSYTESYSLDVVRGDRRSGTRQSVAASLAKPIDYIGTKTLGDEAKYEGYAARHVHAINVPGCATPGRVFVGQRKEAFSVNLGAIFDLVNAPPAFITNEANASAAGKFGDLERKNITSIALELPIACLKGTGDVIGGWTTASLRQGRLLDPSPPSGLQASEKVGGAWTQVSRLGMPLVNEVVIGLPDKDKFNAGKPKNDAALLDYVTNPTLPALLEALFGTKAPTNIPRGDLVAAFLTGIQGVNKPANVTPSEMLRLNTAILPTPIAAQKPLGVIAGDNAGYPNGRRLVDDVVDISLRVAMGRLCHLNGTNNQFGFGTDCNPNAAPSGNIDFVDGTRAAPGDFRSAFPYLNTPLPGAK